MPVKSKKTAIYTIILYAALTLLTFTVFYPFYWMIVNSIRSSAAMLENPLSLFPEELVLDNYKRIVSIGGNSFQRLLGNSLLITGLGIVTIVVSTSLGAYALRRKPNLPGFKFFEVFFLVSIMYPVILLTFPLYVVLHKFRLLGTYPGLTLGVIPWSLAIIFFLFKQFYDKIPDELVQVALIDGASELRILRSIIVPISKPVYFSASLIIFFHLWANWFPIIVISTTSDTFTLSASLFMFNTELGVDLPATMALASTITLPIIIVFVLTQRIALEGMTVGAVKG